MGGLGFCTPCLASSRDLHFITGVFSAGFVLPLPFPSLCKTSVSHSWKKARGNGDFWSRSQVLGWEVQEPPGRSR